MAVIQQSGSGHPLTKDYAASDLVVPIESLSPCPFALQVEPSPSIQPLLASMSQATGCPAGAVIARAPGGGISAMSRYEVLHGWHYVHLLRELRPDIGTVPIRALPLGTGHLADAAYYAIEMAWQTGLREGAELSRIDYAKAVQRAKSSLAGKSRARTSVAELSRAMGVSRPTLANYLRLLTELDPAVQKLVKAGSLSPEYAKELMAVPMEQQAELARVVVAKSEYTKSTLLLREYIASGKYLEVIEGAEAPSVAPMRQVGRRKENGLLQKEQDQIRELVSTSMGLPVEVRLSGSADGGGSVSFPFRSNEMLVTILRTVRLRAIADRVDQPAACVEYKAANQEELAALLSLLTGIIDIPETGVDTE